jgi:hypothetical protein
MAEFHGLTLKQVLRKVGDDFKVHISRKFKILCGIDRTPLGEELLTLEQAYAALGKSEFRLSMIQEIRDAIADYKGRSFLQIKELWEMRENERKFIKLIHEYIRALIYHQGDKQCTDSLSQKNSSPEEQTESASSISPSSTQ